eukprot:INCI15242.1.p1 GENE.INCI15242.1~~INCI15242.1.p1  ORF type:complete len:906 (-),score=218.96 INCI15242.1:400-3117(-)
MVSTSTQKNALGASPLHFACADGTDSLEVAELLLRNGANPSSVEASTGCTPLHYAALVPNVEYVQLLLRSGANPLAEDQEDYLPLDYAKDVYLSEHIAVLTSAGTAKRQGADAYDAFLDNLCVTSGGGESLHTTPLPSYHGGSGGDDIDNLLSELDMNGSLTSSSPSTRAATGGNQSKATEQELQALLADIFTREGVGAATSNKKSLQRSTTSKAIPIFQMQAFEQGAKHAIRVMKETVFNLQIQCEKLQLQKEQFEKAEKDAITKLGNLRAEMMKHQRSGTVSAKSGDGSGASGGATSIGISEEEVESRIRKAVDDAVASEQSKIRNLEEDLEDARQQQAVVAQSAASEAKGSGAKQHAEVVAKLTQQLSQAQKAATSDKWRSAAEVDKLKSRTNKLEEDLRAAHTQTEQLQSECDSLKAQLETAEAAKAKLREDQASFEANLKSQLQQKATTEIAAAMKRAQAEVADTMKKLKGEQKQLEKKYLKEQAMRRKFYNELEDLKGKIRVFCRVRPLSGSEKDRGCAEAVSCADEYSIAVKYELRGRPADASFEFDRVFPNSGEGSSQAEVFADTKRLCQSACDGYNVCIFAYGQTGSGKTFTMMGKEDPPELLGVSPRARLELFNIFKKDSDKFSFSCKASMYEIYKSELVDLMTNVEGSDKPKLYVKTDAGGSVYVENGTVTGELNSAAELDKALESGMATRHVAATLMNSESSRSHLVQIIFIEATNLKSKVSTTGKLTLVDLAGSERADKTGASGDTMEEAKSINQSLSALGNVISALTTGKAHVPYRDAVLTQLMKDCLGGNAKTLMFVNVSPADYNAPETVSSLQFAQRCKTVTNKATASIETAQLKKLKQQLRQLKAGGAAAASAGDGDGGGGPSQGGPKKGGPGGRKGPGGAHKKKKKK